MVTKNLISRVNRPHFTENYAYLETALLLLIKEIELPQGKFDLAESRYKSISEWLDNTPQETALGQIKMKIGPHGGFDHGTAVKPLKGNEFDLDMNGQLYLNWQDIKDPRTIVDALEERFSFNKIYKEILERKTRVIRLNYAGDFHLDFMPCIPLFIDGQLTSIKIPHKVTDLLYVWKDSDPAGFKLWLEEKCKLQGILKKAIRLNEKEDNIILPFPIPEKNKPILKLIIMLLKRARDLYFYDYDDKVKKAVSSVVLTTLAGQFYQGETELSEAFLNISEAMFMSFYHEDSPRILNPINGNEDFAEELRQNKIMLSHFKGFLYDLNQKCQKLSEKQNGIDNFIKNLVDLFGDDAKRIASELGSKTLQATKKNFVGITAGGALSKLGEGTTSKLLPHKYDGDY